MTLGSQQVLRLSLGPQIMGAKTFPDRRRRYPFQKSIQEKGWRILPTRKHGLKISGINFLSDKGQLDRKTFKLL